MKLPSGGVRNDERVDRPDNRWRWGADGQAVQVSRPSRMDRLLAEDAGQPRRSVFDHQFSAGLDLYGGAICRRRRSGNDALVDAGVARRRLADTQDVRLRQIEFGIRKDLDGVVHPPDCRSGGRHSGNVAWKLHGAFDHNDLNINWYFHMQIFKIFQPHLKRPVSLSAANLMTTFPDFFVLLFIY